MAELIQIEAGEKVVYIGPSILMLMVIFDAYGHGSPWPMILALVSLWCGWVFWGARRRLVQQEKA